MALFLVGFLIATLGVALLVLGETPLLGGRVIAARRARWIGGLLVAFFPCLFLVRWIVGLFDTANQIPAPAVGWSLFGVWLCVAFGMVFRSLFPKRMPTQRRSQAANPFEPTAVEDDEPMLEAVDEVVLEEAPAPKPAKAVPAKAPPAKAAPAKKLPPRRPAKDEGNPFDFA